MKKIFLSLVFSIALIGLNAQNHCGFDAIQKALHKNNPERTAQEEQFNEVVLTKYLELVNSGFAGSDEEVTIPVVVHIIHDDGTENISDELVMDGINFLNSAFANGDDYNHPDGFVTGIQFCLAQRDPDNQLTNGINRVQSELTDFLVPGEELEMKNLSRWDPTQYLNIWVVKEITREFDNPGVIGFSSFPPSHGSDLDGIVVEAAYFGSNQAGSSVIVHEVGHYLGLYHTFQDGCFNEDCLLFGDRVCDTPPDSHVFNTICIDGTNSCDTDEDDESDNNPFRPLSLGGLGDQEDIQINFMDYSSLDCFTLFSEGQGLRMVAALYEYRESLLDGNRCLPPCEDPILVDVNLSDADLVFGETANFQNNSTNYDTIEYYVDDEFETSSDDPSISFDEPGIYIIDVYLENGIDGCEIHLEYIITVTCPVVSSFDASSLTFGVGEGGIFNNTSTGATSYEWYIDDVLISTGEDLNFIFSESGSVSLYLVASNDECSTTSEVVYISVGFCNTGNEANQWFYFITATTNIYGFNFNEGADFIVSDNFFPEEGGHCRSTICDQNGDLLFVSTGEEIYDQSFNIMANGGGMAGSFSSHFGTSIVRKPGTIAEYYVFNAANEESNYVNGLTYSVVDMSLNSGLGAVTDVKNVLMETIGTEAISTVNHCNQNDVWLVFYDIPEQAYKSYLVNEDGVADEPVVTSIPNYDFNLLFGRDLRVNPAGTQILHYNYLLDFDQFTGEFSLVHDFGYDFAAAYEFSPNGKVLYMEHGLLDIKLDQYDLTLPIDDMLDQVYTVDLDDFNDVGFDMRTGPDGILYLEEIIANNVSTILNPNIIGAGMNLDLDTYIGNGLMNSLGNYHHAYVYGNSGIFIEGNEQVCLDEEAVFSVLHLNCIDVPVIWTVDYGTIEEQDDGSILYSSDTPGLYTITAELESECGYAITTMEVEVLDLPEVNLGPDLPLCEGEDLVLDAGSGMDTYVWQDGSEGQTYTVTTPGIYSVTVEFNGCSNTDEIEIQEAVAGIINLGEDVEICDSEILILSIEDFWIDPIWQDGTPGHTYTVYEAGTYSVSSNVPCFVEDEIVVTYCGHGGQIDPVGVEQVGLELEWNIFPNPNQGNFIITGDLSELLTIEVYNSIGQLVYSQSNTFFNSNQTEVQLRNVANGIYEVRLIAENGYTTKKVLISE